MSCFSTSVITGLEAAMEISAGLHVLCDERCVPEFKNAR